MPAARCSRVLRVTDQHTFWILCANASSLASQAAMLVVLAKSGSAKMVGQFGLGLAIVTPVMLFAKLQLRPVLVTDAGSEFSLLDYLRVRLGAAGAAFLLLSSAAAVSGLASQTAQVVAAVALIKALEAISDLFAAIFQRQTRLAKMACCALIRGAGAPLVLGAGLFGFDSLAAALLCVAAWYGLIVRSVEFPPVRGLLFNNSPAAPPQAGWGARVKRLLALALPLGIVATLVSLNANLLRYLVSGFLGVEALGYFTAMTQLLVISNVFVQALGQAALPNLAGGNLTDRSSFYRTLAPLLGGALALGAAGVAAAALFGGTILSFVYRPDYASYAGVLVWLAIGTAVAFLSSMLGYTMTALRIFRAQVPLYGCAALVTLAGGLAWIPTYGLWGAAYANLAGWSAAAIGSAGVLLRSIPHDFRRLEAAEA